ncbi:MAG: hypothetical protein A2W28_11865 [Gammaproteobacteria bacterium RBG_16_51_14]|nr:MAG: hypothetical protein A2W28_11865 [Gammaproteobacteria bacterium RBG_16_51_14]
MNKHLQPFQTSPALKSAVKGITWPAIYRPDTAQYLAMQFWLDQSQWLSGEELRERQFRQAQGLLEHAAATVPYYRDSFRAAGVIPGKGFIMDYWPGIPLLKRVTLQQQATTLLSRQIPPSHGKTTTVTTSGSTGTPVTVTKTQLMQFFLDCIKLRDVAWGRLDTGKKLAVIRLVKNRKAARPPDGLHHNGWGKPFDQLYNTSSSSLLNIETPVIDQAGWLGREDPDYLLTFPTNLNALAQFLGNNNQSLPNLQQIMTIGECLSPDVRAVCEEFFQVPIKDVYSSQELGYIALQCPDHPNYHVQSETVLVEVLDDNDQPCQAGEVGRLVVTSLHNFAMPLIRYEVGDYAEVGGPCPCGRGLPVLNRIYGRVRNMLTLPSGEKTWPRIGSQYYAASTGAAIRQAQVIQHSLEQIEVRLAVDRPLNEQQEARLTPLIREALGHPFSISYCYLDEIPRSKGGKFEEFLSHIGT